MSLSPVHPFPARMASSIPWSELAEAGDGPLQVLDPMMGSGTTLAVARKLGHQATGIDTDPLAILISSVICHDLPPDSLRRMGQQVLSQARLAKGKIKGKDAFPEGSSSETRKFIRFWFDLENRKQLFALSKYIGAVSDATVKNALWCAFSRLIIVKSNGASLAMDISHSRPHKVLNQKTLRPFNGFISSIEKIIKAATFPGANPNLPAARALSGDARQMPIEDASVDVVITSPPYLNAIDYLRGHKFSLVWMGYQVEEIRVLRSSNIGSEMAGSDNLHDEMVTLALSKMGDACSLPERDQRQLARYIRDMDSVFSEMRRVLKPCGKIVMVIGNSIKKGLYLSNSEALTFLGERHGMRRVGHSERMIPPTRRYLPPPGSRSSGKELRSRMNSEVVLTFQKLS